MNKEKKLKLLKRLEDDLQQELIAAMIGEAEGNLPEILNVIFNDIGLEADQVFGEYFFRPEASDNDTVVSFTGMLTLTEVLPDEHIADLLSAISYINFHLPAGCFCIDRAHSCLVFRLSALIPQDMPDDEILTQMNLVCANSVQTADRFIDLLIALSKGEKSLSEVLSAVYIE